MPVEVGHATSDLAFDAEGEAEPFAKLRNRLDRHRSRTGVFGAGNEDEHEGDTSGDVRGAPAVDPEPQETARLRQATLAAFKHPAARVEQQTVWIPTDRLGLGEDAVRRYGAAGIRASTQGAALDGRGKVQVEEGPPDPDQQKA